MNYSYTIDSIDAESIAVTYTRAGYPDRVERHFFNGGVIGNSVDAERVHQIVTNRAPNAYWRRIDQISGNATVADLQPLVGQTFDHSPAR